MKQVYSTPRLTVYGDINDITRHHTPGHNPPGNAFGHSCGNGNVNIPISCGEGVPSSNSNSKHQN